MNWDQIEIKWAEMTKRMRADVPMRGAAVGKTNDGAVSKNGSPAGDPLGPPTSAQTEQAVSAASLANVE